MRELFPGFYKRTDEELSECWKKGIFIFDTNMLLNVYRYTQKTKDRYFEILDILKNRGQLWIPYQVAYEYQNNRIEVIQGQIDAYTDVSSMLQTTLQRLESSLEPYKRKHGFIDAERLAQELASVIKKAKFTVTQGKETDKREYEALKQHDRLLEKLENLFQGNIGSPYSNSKLDELYKQARLRVELRIPPGWEDEGKNSIRAYGDIILWFQLLDYSRMQKKPVIFVTDDRKKDWWIRDTSGKPIKPLPALVQEIFVEAGVLLHMYQGYEFLEQAEHFLKLAEKPEIIEEAKGITEQNTENTYHPSLIAKGYFVESAVYEWIKTQYPQSEIIQNIHREPDFVVVDKDDTRIGFEVKHFNKLQNVHKVVERTLSMLERSAQGHSFNIKILNIVVVTNSEEDAINAAERIQSFTDIPENVSVIVGYWEPDNQFHFIARLF